MLPFFSFPSPVPWLLNRHLMVYGALKTLFILYTQTCRSSPENPRLHAIVTISLGIGNFIIIMTKLSHLSCLLGLDFDHILQPAVIWKTFLHLECVDMKMSCGKSGCCWCSLLQNNFPVVIVQEVSSSPRNISQEISGSLG